MTTFNLIIGLPSRPSGSIETSAIEMAETFRRKGMEKAAESVEFALDNGFIHYDRMTGDEIRKLRETSLRASMSTIHKAVAMRVDFQDDALAVQFALMFNKRALA